MAMSTEFNVGTIVKLKSGGPDMTIRSIGKNYSTNKPDGYVDCQWFAGKKLEHGTFPKDSLEVVELTPKAEV